MAGERERLVADPLHQAAVAAKDVGVVVDDLAAELCGQHALGERHADRVAEPLAERPGRRLDAARMAALGMAGGAAAELPETLDLGDRHVGIAGQVQEPVEQHRAVPVRHDEAVAVGPIRGLRVKAQVLREQHRRDVGHAHRHAGMAGFGLFDGVHRERAQRVGHVAQLRVARSGERRGNVVHRSTLPRFVSKKNAVNAASVPERRLGQSRSRRCRDERSPILRFLRGRPHPKV